MKKLCTILLCLAMIGLIAVAALYRDELEINKMVATILLREHQDAGSYSRKSEAKKRALDQAIEEEGKNHLEQDHDQLHDQDYDNDKDYDHFHDHDRNEDDYDHFNLAKADDKAQSHHDEEHHQGNNQGDEHEPDHEEGVVALTEEQIKGLALDIQTADKGGMLLTLSTRGKVTVDPDRLAHVIPKVSGIAVEARKNIGNYVKRGEIIAILESQDIADLKAAYLAAISKEKLTSSILQREKVLYQKGVTAGEDFFTAQNANEEALINLQLAIHKLRAFEIPEDDIRSLTNKSDSNLRTYPIYAPIDGMVIMRHITQGEHIEDTATIYEIADFSHVWVEAGIYPKDLHRLRDGQVVEVTNPETAHTTEARLIYISPIVADDTIAAKAIALLDNPHGVWRPGSFVKVSIATDQISCPLLICKEAIQKIDGKDCAFVPTDKGFEKRELQLGRSDRNNVEVLSGLVPGEKYVANRSFLLKAEMNKELAADHD